MADITPIDPDDARILRPVDILKQAIKDIEAGIIDPASCVIVTDEQYYYAGIGSDSEATIILLKAGMEHLFEDM